MKVQDLEVARGGAADDADETAMIAGDLGVHMHLKRVAAHITKLPERGDNRTGARKFRDPDDLGYRPIRPDQAAAIIFTGTS